MRGRTPDPNSVSGRIRTMVAEAKALEGVFLDPNPNHSGGA